MSDGPDQGTSIVFISAAKCLPAGRERGRDDNKNLCEHFEEKRECNVENMRRHVS